MWSASLRSTSSTPRRRRRRKSTPRTTTTLTTAVRLTASWGTDTATANVKFNWDLGAARVVRGLVLYNYTAKVGIKHFEVYGTSSASAFSNVTYSDTTDLTLLGTYDAAEVTNADDPPQYFTFSNSTAYRYIVLRIATCQDATGNYLGFYHVQALSTTQYSGYEILTPGVDYVVQRQAASGSQTLYFRKLKAGTHDIVIDSF